MMHKPASPANGGAVNQGTKKVDQEKSELLSELLLDVQQKDIEIKKLSGSKELLARDLRRAEEELKYRKSELCVLKKTLHAYEQAVRGLEMHSTLLEQALREITYTKKVKDARQVAEKGLVTLNDLRKQGLERGLELLHQHLFLGLLENSHRMEEDLAHELIAHMRRMLEKDFLDPGIRDRVQDIFNRGGKRGG